MDTQGALILGLVCLGGVVLLSALAIASLILVGRRSRQAANLYTEGRSAYEQGDYAAALELFRSASESGYAQAQLALGNMHLRGRGVARDPQEAARLITRAAERGLASAQYRLGQMYHQGNGVRPSLKEAERWLRAAAAQGYAAADVALRDVEGQLAGGVAEAQSPGDQPTWTEDRESLADKPTWIEDRASLADKPTWIEDRASLADKPTWIEDRASLADQPTWIEDQESLADRPTWIEDRRSLADRPTTIKGRPTAEDMPPGSAADVPTSILSAPQPMGMGAIWCPQCASPMQVHATQQGALVGRLYRCPTCGYSCDEGDPRASIPPRDPARCLACGAVNDWERTGDVRKDGRPDRRCRTCGRPHP